MLLKKLAIGIREQNGVTILIEFVIVFVGIFVGLQVDAWWQERSEARMEVSYLRALHEDFQRNAAFLVDIRSGHEQTLEAMLLLLDAGARPAEERDERSLTDAFRRVHAMPSFSPVLRTYNNLIGSGELRLIRDPRVLNALAAFERRIGILLIVQNTHELELVETFQPYIIDHLDYLALALDRTEGAFPLPPPVDEAPLAEKYADRVFRNVVVQKWMISADLAEQTRLALEDTQAVIFALENALGMTGVDAR